jgi:peptide/nickel transport system substrate-binding protein
MPSESAFGRFGDPAGDPGALDPHRDWPAPDDTWELFRCCLARNLLSTNGQSTDKGGSRIHPDVAASLPEISGDGLTWTFRLKQGLHYSPPLQDVEITAPDFIRSFHRFMAPGYDDEYAPTLYNDIVGASEYRAGTASSISGLESPDPNTLVIRLSAPAGDLAPRLATTGWIPIPASPRDPQARFGVAEGHDDGYGRFVVSSGPYMIEGTPALDFSLPPEQQQPLSGLVPGESLVLVPNPSWDPATDPLRVAHSSRIELQIVPTLDEAIERIHAATADLIVNSAEPIPADEAEAVRQDPGLGRLFVHETGTLVGLTMNTALPPFDDLHVRRAVNHVVNKVAVIDVQGGPLLRRVAHHVVPDSMEDNLLLDYRPYGSPAGTGDLEAAKAEMAQSTYDTDGDGLCDAEACRGVKVASGAPDVADALVGALDQIGIEVDREYLDGAEAYLDPSLKGALFIPQGWGRDYLSASNFFVGQFYSPVALAGVGNASLVGASPEQLADWGYDVVEVPNLDSRIEACIPLTGAAQFECWAALDQYMMENVASFVPLGAGVSPILASRRVIGFAWDELAVAPSYDRIELAP